MRRRKTAGLAAIAIALAGQPVHADGASLEGTDWTVTVMADTADETVSALTPRPTVSFDDNGRLSAYAGCNRMAANATLVGDTITVSPIMSTKMACPEALMKTDMALAAALARANGFSVSGETLVLLADNGAIVLKAKRAP